ALRRRDTTALDPEGAARARAGGDPEGDRVALQRGHADVGTEHGLGVCDRHREREVTAVAAEQRVIADRDDDGEVAGGATVVPGAAPALRPDALTAVDAGGDADLDGPRPHLDARAPTRGARVLDGDATARAGGARLAEGEVALVVVEGAPAAAARAGGR